MVNKPPAAKDFVAASPSSLVDDDGDGNALVDDVDSVGVVVVVGGVEARDE